MNSSVWSIGSATARRSAVVAVAALALLVGLAGPSNADKDSRPHSVPGGGTLMSNVWHSIRSTSGNTYRWDYQVSAVYTGSQRVTYIRTMWTVGSCMKNGSSFTIGVSKDGFSIGSGSSWTCGAVTAHWTNTNGAKTASWRSTAVAAPAKYYQSDSIWARNVARVYTSGYKKPTDVTASI